MTRPRLDRLPTLLIFDLDGTLVDSQEAIARSFNVALAAAGAEPAPHAGVHALIGLPLAQMFTQFLPPSRTEAIPRCIAVYREHHDAVEIPRLQTFPGVLSTLAACGEAGFTSTIATTKSQQVAEAVVSAAGLLPFFRLVLGGDQVAQHKPHPAMVLHTLETLAIDAADALVIGDSSYDMLMAAGAGVRACGVTYGAQPAEALRAAGADHLIDAMPELQELLGIGWSSGNGAR